MALKKLGNQKERLWAEKGLGIVFFATFFN